jgi:hypothetical protein
MCKKPTKKKAGARDNPVPLNFITINGMTLSLGDLRKEDFSSIQNPKASVKSIQDTLIALLNVLRGFSET